MAVDDRPPTWAELDAWAIESSPSALVVSLACRSCGGVLTVSRGPDGMAGPPITLGQVLRTGRGTNHLAGCPVQPWIRDAGGQSSTGEQG